MMPFDDIPIAKPKGQGATPLGSAKHSGLAVCCLLLVGVVGVGIFLPGQVSVESGPAAYAEDTGEPAEAPERVVVVHVGGGVAEPGVYRLPEGSRAGDAVEAAGGFADDAMRDAINLARVLADGEQIVIPLASAGATQDAVGPRRININTASAEELMTLKGIGESTARKFVSYRLANGSFKSVQELTQVSGIGQKKLEAILDDICV